MTKRKTSVQKFQKFWSKLSPTEHKELWNLMSAIRGPDDFNEMIKEQTTAKIRGFLFPTENNNRVDYLDDVGGLFSRESIYDSDMKFLKTAQDHFKSHVICAYVVISKMQNPQVAKNFDYYLNLISK